MYHPAAIPRTILQVDAFAEAVRRPKKLPAARRRSKLHADQQRQRRQGQHMGPRHAAAESAAAQAPRRSCRDWVGPHESSWLVLCCAH